MLQPEEIGNDKVNEQIELLENSLHDHTQQKKEMLNTGLVSDLFDRNILETLKSYFEQSSFRHNSLPAEQFKALISQYIPRPIVDSVYRSIDVNDVGYVNYSDFTNYLIASEAGSSFSAKIYISRLVPMLQQEDDASIMHRDGIDCIAYVKRPCPMIITGGRDGQLSIWDPDNLLLMKNIEHLDKNAVYKEELRKSMDGLLRAQTKAEDKYASNVKMSITAMCPILNWGLLCVGSADSCVTVYELGNQVSLIETRTSLSHKFYRKYAVELLILTQFHLL
jgi:WD40 repeat protein